MRPRYALLAAGAVAGVAACFVAGSVLVGSAQTPLGDTYDVTCHTTPSDMTCSGPKRTTTTEVPTSTTQATTTTSSSTTSTTSTTVPPTTTVAPTTTQPPTTVAPTTSSSAPTPSCGLTAAAFCDTFSTATPGGSTRRSGDLDPELWGVSRANTLVNVGQGNYNTWEQSNMVGPCGSITVQAPRDVRICNGRLVDAVSDGGGQPILAMYPKQPFDFAGRTGKVVFDLSADSGGPHSAWPEFWITDRPIPAPHAGELPAQFSYAQHGVGFHFGTDRCPAGQTGVYQINVVRNYVPETFIPTSLGCVTKGSATGTLNHFELRVSQTRVEVWATDAGGASFRQIAVVDNANLSFTRGLVWFEDVHYNADKFDTQGAHTFVWDNLGFDGPKTYRDLSFDVPDANTAQGAGAVNLGYITRNGAITGFDTASVFQRQTPTGAIVTFNWVPQQTHVPDVRVNGGPWHSTAWPFDGATFGWRTISVPVSLAEIRVGVNRIEFRDTTADVVLSNINLILVAGASVP